MTYSHRHRYLYRCVNCLEEETVIRNVPGDKRECPERALGLYCIGVVYVDACHKCAVVYASYSTYQAVINIDWRGLVREMKAGDAKPPITPKE